MWSLKHIKVFLLILKSYSFFSLQFDDCIKATEFHEVSRSLILLQIYINMNNQSFCLSPCHSLSEQITPAANFAAALWQLTVLWYWHWLRAISFPMHFTPLITMSVTLLLSQYQVSLKRYNKTGTRAKTKKTKNTVRRSGENHSQTAAEFSALLRSEKQMFMTHFWPLNEDTV